MIFFGLDSSDDEIGQWSEILAITFTNQFRMAR